MPRSILVPITNVHAKGSFTAQVDIGSQNQTANLILDSGSSTMVVQAEDYDPAVDESLQPTCYAQSVIYGMGGWAGPVVKTHVDIGHGDSQVGIETNIAVTRKEKTGCFGNSDGLLGLAYKSLNKANDLTEYLRDNNVEPCHTYPWFLAEEQQDDSLREFRRFLRGYPRHVLTPYFTQLEQQGIVGNQFAFVIHRSSIYHTEETKTLEELGEHPLNRGIFVMGLPRLEGDLHDGNFREVKVLHEKYYNAHLTQMQVGDSAPIPAPELAEEDVAGHISNAIIDSGASMVMLPKALFDGLFEHLIAHNPDFEAVLEPFRVFEGVEKGIPIDQVKLEEWPDLYFTLDGFDGEKVTLTMTPQTYWQIHAPKSNEISFQFVYLPSWPNQAVLGLPLMNNYFTVFDRSQNECGAVLFAAKSFEPHRLPDAVLSKAEVIKEMFEEQKVTL